MFSEENLEDITLEINRQDDIYKEIEKFEDYELTNNIAYEMAIRNEKVKGIITSLKEVSNICDIALNDIKAIDIDKKNEIGKLSHLDIIITMLEELEATLKKEYFITVNYSALKKNDKLILIEKYSKQDQTKSSDKKGKISLKFRGGLILEQGISENKSEFHTSTIKPRFKRDYFTQGKVVNVQLNLSLPKSELLGYISYLKDLTDAENLVNIPIELLGDLLEDYTTQKNYPKKQTSQKMADMFFIYDYVKDRLNFIEEANSIANTEYNESLSILLKNPLYTSRDKQIQKESLLKERDKEMLEMKIVDIFKEIAISQELDMKPDAISKHYYAIKPYIDDLKYKELITGKSL